MPYCKPHHTIRNRIIDLEVMRLELRKTSRERQVRAASGRTRA
jgi:hypothetical protein